MSPAFPARKRADEFDRLVAADAASDRRATKAADELRELAALATSLATVGDAAVPRRDFSVSLRERLMTAAETELAPAREAAATPDKTVERKLTVGLSPKRQRSRQRRLSVAVVALAIVGGTAGAATASQSALPGDSLYPMKRAVENVSAGFTPSPRARGLKVLHDASNRLHEIRSLSDAQQQDLDPARVNSTLDTFSSQAALGSDLLIRDFRTHHRVDSINQLRTFAADSVQELAELHSNVPQGAQDSLSDAARTLLMIDQASAALCQTCQGGISELPASLVATLSPDADVLPDDSLQEAQALPPLTPDNNSLQLPSIDPDKLGPGSVKQTDPHKKKHKKKPAKGDDSSLLPLPSTSPSVPEPSGSASSNPVGSTVTTLDNTVGTLVDGLTSVIKSTTGGLLGK